MEQKIQKYRTINKALQGLKQLDPETAITYRLIKTLCENNSVLTLTVGNRTLVNFDSILEYFNCRNRNTDGNHS